MSLSYNVCQELVCRNRNNPNQVINAGQYEDIKNNAHPDRGGSNALFKRLNNCKDVLFEEPNNKLTCEPPAPGASKATQWRPAAYQNPFVDLETNNEELEIQNEEQNDSDANEARRQEFEEREAKRIEAAERAREAIQREKEERIRKRKAQTEAAAAAQAAAEAAADAAAAEAAANTAAAKEAADAAEAAADAAQENSAATAAAAESEVIDLTHIDDEDASAPPRRRGRPRRNPAPEPAAAAAAEPPRRRGRPRTSERRAPAEKDEEHTVHAVMRHRVDPNGVREYFIKWEGFPVEEGTWETAENLRIEPFHIFLRDYWVSFEPMPAGPY